jgi:8-oxo-dGTP pyrophosphatase MutT (NUDIX family)
MTTSYIDRVDLAFEPKPWAFAAQRRVEIDAHFAQLKRHKPELWNGTVMLLHEHTVASGLLRGSFIETDFASFTAWRHWGRPETGVLDCFGAAAILTADDAFLLGVMAAHTVNAGHVYFPCGTPDRNDRVDGKVDLDVSVARELTEETGLDVTDFAVEPGWTMVRERAHLALFKTMRAREDADTLRAKVRRHLDRERQPELADIRFARGPADLDPAMPSFIVSYLKHRWG